MSHHPTIKFTAEVSDTETTFLDTKVYKGVRFAKEWDISVHTFLKAATHQGSRRTSLKAKHLDFSEL